MPARGFKAAIPATHQSSSLIKCSSLFFFSKFSLKSILSKENSMQQSSSLRKSSKTLTSLPQISLEIKSQVPDSEAIKLNIQNWIENLTSLIPHYQIEKSLRIEIILKGWIDSFGHQIEISRGENHRIKMALQSDKHRSKDSFSQNPQDKIFQETSTEWSLSSKIMLTHEFGHFLLEQFIQTSSPQLYYSLYFSDPSVINRTHFLSPYNEFFADFLSIGAFKDPSVIHKALLELEIPILKVPFGRDPLKFDPRRRDAQTQWTEEMTRQIEPWEIYCILGPARSYLWRHYLENKLSNKRVSLFLEALLKAITNEVKYLVENRINTMDIFERNQRMIQAFEIEFKRLED